TTVARQSYRRQNPPNSRYHVRMRGGPMLQLGLILTMALTGALAQQVTTPAPTKTASAPKALPQRSVPKKLKDEPSIDPRQVRLLKESYAASASLDPTARAILLEKQCHAAENVEDLAKSWCTELFQLAKDQLPSGDFRAHVQSSAARA